jgi:putative acetyltransferase
MALIIRDARASERDAVQAVTLAAYHEYAAALPAQWEGYRRNIVDTLAAASPGEQIVAERDGVIVGAVLLHPAGTPRAMPGGLRAPLPLPEVRLLAVAPAGRGQGVGAALMRACIRRARRSGAAALGLHTTDVMQAALRLYARLGFRRTPESDFQPAPGVTAKGFRLDLETIRPEVPADAAAVRAVHEAAFPTPQEARLVEALRAAGKSVIALVAEAGGRVVGHVLFSPVRVERGARRGLGLAPVAVLPACQSRGIGSALIEAGLAEARPCGYHFAVVLGEPGYYARFGFARASAHGLASEYGVDEAFMVLTLVPGGLDGMAGLVRYAPEFGMVTG